eukprot:13096481-Ditylum_brightwellii.AAC.1
MLRYDYIPLHLPCTCDGCGAKFTVQHALSCPKGGLVLIRHDNASWEFGELGKQGLLPSTVSYKPHIFTGTWGGGGSRGVGGATRGGAGGGAKSKWRGRWWRGKERAAPQREEEDKAADAISPRG